MKRRIQAGIIGDVLRKASLSGVGEIRLPSDVRRVIVANIENMREGAIEVFAREISKVLAKVDFQHILDDVLKNYTLRLEAKIELVPKGKSKEKKAGAPKGKSK